uniref:GATA-type domain-containing protein n=1 Tax=Rhabditophanes sp. KR3021 TaxID=114890 RepID=A0AC35TS28_9BILA
MENIQVNPCMFDNVPANLHRTSPIQMQANPIGSQFYQTYPHNPYLSFDSMPPTAHPMAQIINRNGSPIQVSMDNRSHHGEMNFNKRKNAIKRVSIHSDSVCVNCKTTKTTLWRRSNSGEPECNSCNLYFRANQRPRPANLIKKTILKRQRKKIGQYNSPVGNTCNMSQLPLDMKEFFEEQKEQ